MTNDTQKVVGHIFGTNFRKYTHAFITNDPYGA